MPSAWHCARAPVAHASSPRSLPRPLPQQGRVGEERGGICEPDPQSLDGHLDCKDVQVRTVNRGCHVLRGASGQVCVPGPRNHVTVCDAAVCSVGTRAPSGHPANSPRARMSVLSPSSYRTLRSEAAADAENYDSQNPWSPRNSCEAPPIGCAGALNLSGAADPCGCV